MAAPIIETDRLLMQSPFACDLDGWTTFSADETATRFLGGVQPRSIAWRSMAGAAGGWSLQGFVSGFLDDRTPVAGLSGS